MNIYSVRDLLAGEFGPLFVSKNDEVAKRQYRALIQQNSVNPKEFVLYNLGVYNPDDASVPIEPITPYVVYFDEEKENF